jgi:hypothetical protein
VSSPNSITRVCSLIGLIAHLTVGMRDRAVMT